MSGSASFQRLSGIQFCQWCFDDAISSMVGSVCGYFESFNSLIRCSNSCSIDFYLFLLLGFALTVLRLPVSDRLVVRENVIAGEKPKNQQHPDRSSQVEILRGQGM